MRTGQGAETEAGFSFQTNVDLWYRSRSRDIQSAAMLERTRPSTAVLFLPAEKDELIGGNRSALAVADEVEVVEDVKHLPFYFIHHRGV